VETFGAVGESAMDFLQELGRRIANTAAEQHSCTFFLQRLSAAVQRAMLSASLSLHRRTLVWTMKSLYYYSYISKVTRNVCKKSFKDCIVILI